MMAEVTTTATSVCILVTINHFKAVKSDL